MIDNSHSRRRNALNFRVEAQKLKRTIISKTDFRPKNFHLPSCTECFVEICLCLQNQWKTRQIGNSILFIAIGCNNTFSNLILHFRWVQCIVLGANCIWITQTSSYGRDFDMFTVRYLMWEQIIFGIKSIMTPISSECVCLHHRSLKILSNKKKTIDKNKSQSLLLLLFKLYLRRSWSNWF